MCYNCFMPRATKRIDNLWERIGRLKEKSRGYYLKMHQ
ncbi:MAG: hypothetical protein MAG794_00775 [Gammaproteobacteria bacterium]|nr:hypothetical protein [Gammaproteobacteria bacterium]